MAVLWSDDYESGAAIGTNYFTGAPIDCVVSTVTPIQGTYSVTPNPARTLAQRCIAYFAKDSLSPSPAGSGRYTVNITGTFRHELAASKVTPAGGFNAGDTVSGYTMFYLDHGGSSQNSGKDLLLYDRDSNLVATAVNAITPNTNQKVQIIVELSSLDSSGDAIADGSAFVYVDDVEVINVSGELFGPDFSTPDGFATYDGIEIGPMGTFDLLNIEDTGLATPPANDPCASPEVIATVPASIIADPAAATQEISDPVPSVVMSALFQTIWYEYEAEETGTLRIRTTGMGGTSVIYIATGVCGTWVEVASIEDTILDVVVTQGITYRIMLGWTVDGEGVSGTLELGYLISGSSGAIGITTDLQRVINQAPTTAPIIAFGITPFAPFSFFTFALYPGLAGSQVNPSEIYLKYRGPGGLTFVTVTTPTQAGHFTSTTPQEWVGSPSQTFEVEFQLSTYDPTLGTSLADGWFKIYIDGTLVYELLDIQLGTAEDEVNWDTVLYSPNGSASSYYIRNISTRLAGYGQAYPAIPNTPLTFGGDFIVPPLYFPVQNDFSFPTGDPTLLDYGNYSQKSTTLFFTPTGNWIAYGNLGNIAAEFRTDWANPLAGSIPTSEPLGFQYLWGYQGGSIYTTMSSTPPVANPGAGIYQIVKGKTNDTIYLTQGPVTTVDVAIPNPRIVGFLLGDE